MPAERIADELATVEPTQGILQRPDFTKVVLFAGPQAEDLREELPPKNFPGDNALFYCSVIVTVNKRAVQGGICKIVRSAGKHVEIRERACREKGFFERRLHVVVHFRRNERFKGLLDDIRRFIRIGIICGRQNRFVPYGIRNEREHVEQFSIREPHRRIGRNALRHEETRATRHKMPRKRYERRYRIRKVYQYVEGQLPVGLVFRTGYTDVPNLEIFGTQ